MAPPLVRPKDNPSEPEQFFLRIFDSFADPLAVYDQNFQILKANPALLKFYQRSAEQLLGSHCYKIFMAAAPFVMTAMSSRSLGPAKPSGGRCSFRCRTAANDISKCMPTR